MGIYYNTFGFCEASETTPYLKAAEEHKERRADQVAHPGRSLSDTGGGMMANQVRESRVGGRTGQSRTDRSTETRSTNQIFSNAETIWPQKHVWSLLFPLFTGHAPRTGASTLAFLPCLQLGSHLPAARAARLAVASHVRANRWPIWWTGWGGEGALRLNFQAQTKIRLPLRLSGGRMNFDNLICETCCCVHTRRIPRTVLVTRSGATPLSGIFIVRLVFKTKTHGLEIRVQKKKIIHQQQNVFSIWMKMGSSLLAENWRVKCFWRRGQRRRRERRESSSLPYLSRGTT